VKLRTDAVVPSLALLLFDPLEVVLAFPGDVAGGVLSTKALISTFAVTSGYRPGRRSLEYWIVRSVVDRSVVRVEVSLYTRK